MKFFTFISNLWNNFRAFLYAIDEVGNASIFYELQSRITKIEDILDELIKKDG